MGEELGDDVGVEIAEASGGGEVIDRGGGATGSESAEVVGQMAGEVDGLQGEERGSEEQSSAVDPEQGGVEAVERCAGHAADDVSDERCGHGVDDTWGVGRVGRGVRA